MENANAALILHEEIPTTAEDILEKIFQEHECLLPNQMFFSENYDSDGDKDVPYDENVSLPPTRKNVQLCVAQLSTLQPMDDFS
jgi:hypothetical protein